MRNLLAAALLASSALLGAASQARADGFDGAGLSTSGLAIQDQGRSPLAGASLTPVPYGDAQGYALGRSAVASAPAGTRTMLAGPDALRANFDLGTQGQ